MNKTYQSLPVTHLNENNTFSHPPELPELVHIEDPAHNVIMNFDVIKPVVVHPKTPINDALIEMKAAGTHIMLVIEDSKVVGVISSEDILGEKPMQIIQERRIRRDEILVQSIMTPREKLVTIQLSDLRIAKVGHVIKTLNEHKQHYAIIVENDGPSQQQIVHGLVYIYEILKRLDKDIVTELREARSILELQKNLD